MKSRKTKTIITIIILVMALLQLPLFYYRWSGFIKMIFDVPYSLIGLGLTISLLNALIKYKSTNSRYHIFGLIFTILIAFPTRFQKNAMEYFDWKLQFDKRSKIVEQIRTGILKPDAQGKYIINDTSFLPVSNGGNEINVTRNKGGVLEIEFYIDRGFLDHYTSLVYTDRKQVLPSKDNDTITTLNEHWYTVHF